MKRMKLFMATIMAMVVATVSVNAEKVTDWTITNSLTQALEIVQGDALTIGTDKVDQIHVTVKVNDNNIAAILAQAPGNASSKASLGMFYFGLEPKNLEFGSKHINKEVVEIGTADNALTTALTKGIADAKAKADGFAAKSQYDTNHAMWDLAVQIKYNKDGVWTDVETPSNGRTTIAENLKDLLDSDTEITAADYGTKFIFSVPENVVHVWAYRLQDGDSTPTYNYVAVDYKIEFPIVASNGQDGYYFKTLEEALENADDLAITNIVVNDDVTVTDDVVIPAGVKISASEGHKITFNGNVKLENKAELGANVTIAEGKDVTYAITVSAPDGEHVTVDKKEAKEGEEVTVTVKQEADQEWMYEVYDAEGNEIKVTDGKFVMPASTVIVYGYYEPINPKTGDNIVMFVGVATISLLGLGLAVRSLRKEI